MQNQEKNFFVNENNLETELKGICQKLLRGYS